DSVRTGYRSRANPPDPGPDIANLIKGELGFVFDPKITSLPAHRMNEIANRLGQAGYPEHRQITADMVNQAKIDFLKDTKISARYEAVQSLLSKAEEVRRTIHQRLMRPLS